jgi:hypothetical protein
MPPMDAMQPSDDVKDVAALGPSNVPQPQNWLTAAMANWRLGGDDTPEGIQANKADAYGQLAPQLAKMGAPIAPFDPDDPDASAHNLWLGVTAAKAKDPNAFSQITATTENEFNQWTAGRMGAHAADEWTAAGGGWGTSLVPGLIGMLRKPEELPLMLLGAGEAASTKLLPAAGRIFGIGVIQSAIDAPDVVKAHAALGEDYTSNQMIGDALQSGAGNVALAGIHVAGAKLITSTLARFRDNVPPPLQTPTERDAAYTLGQEAETMGSSPYTDTAAGNAEHARQLEEAIARIQGGPPPGEPPAPPGAAPEVSPAVPVTPAAGTIQGQIYAGLKARGLNDMQARVVAAGSHAEASTGPTAINPKSGALGIGQWLGTRKAAIVSLYGEHPTLDQQLDFMVNELHGGDYAGPKVLAHTDEASMLRSYIEDFMRPAKGYEHDRDIAAGMKALGREGEVPPELEGAAPAEGEGEGLSPETIADLTAEPVDTSEPATAPSEPAAPAEPPTAAANAAVAAEGMAPRESTPAPEIGARTAPIGDPRRFDPDSPEVAAALEDMHRGNEPPPAQDPAEAALAAQSNQPELRPDLQRQAQLERVRQVIADKRVSLTDLGALADRLEMSEKDLRSSLDRLVGTGELGQVKKKGAAGRRVKKGLEEPGPYRRIAAPATHGPIDMVKFLARAGGLSYDGLSEREREIDPHGHDLKNTGNLDHFVPGAGKLLQKNGMSLDAAGELLHEQGYFGPPETAPRPTGREVIDALDHSIRTGQKIYGPGDGAGPIQKIVQARGLPEGYQSSEHFEHDRGLWQQSAERTIGRDLTDQEFAAVHQIFNEGIPEPFASSEFPDPEAMAAGKHYDEYIREMVNREADAWIDDTRHESKEDRYAATEQQFRDATAAQEARAARDGVEGSEIDPGDARGGGEGAGTLSGDGRPPELTPAERDAADAAGLGTPPVNNPEANKKFDEPFGEGVTQAADSAWHDLETESKALEEYRKTYVSPKTGEEAAALLWDEDASPERVAEFARGWEAGRHGEPKPANEDSDEFEGWHIGDRTRELLGEKTEAPGEPAPSLDLGEAVDPNLARKQAQELDIAAQQPLQGARKTGAAQNELMPEGLFAGPEAPKFDLEDGAGPRTITQIANAFDAEQAAIDAIKGCQE